MSTNTCSYTICSAPNVYVFVYILLETHIAPLRFRAHKIFTKKNQNNLYQINNFEVRKKIFFRDIVLAFIVNVNVQKAGSLAKEI